MGRAQEIRFTLDSFIPPFDAPFDLHLDHDGTPDLLCRRSIVLAGQPATGKTSRALAEFARPLLAHQIEDVHRVVIAGPNATTHIVFDEADFSSLSPEDCIRLLDCDYERTLPGRYKNVRFPAIPRIFVTNKSLQWPHEHIFPAGQNLAQHKAILRRFRVIRVTERLYRAPQQQQPDPQQQPAVEP